MRTRLPLTIAAATVAAVLTFTIAAARPDAPSIVTSGVSPTLQSIGPLAIGPAGTLYVGDPQAASIFALDLAAQPGGAPGTKDVDGIDQKIAAMLGTAASEIAITDLKVEPKSRNSFIAVMRGKGQTSAPALLRVDGNGKIELVSLEGVKFSSVALPNAPDLNPERGQSNRRDAITNIAFTNGKLYVAGLSNEEFASKLWAVGYPFAAADRGASVEIFHGSHGRLETRSPVYTFIPYTANGEADLIAAYTCTPLVRFPVASLQAGSKVRGTTIAELGAGNRPLDMILYRKDGNEYLLMSNTSRGVMKIPTKDFGTNNSITTPISGTAGIAYETISSMTGVQQMDLLDATHSIVVAKSPSGALNLQAVALP